MANRNQLRYFQVEEFFRSLQNILILSFENTQGASFDSAKFQTRRLDVFERTLNVLLQRIREAYPAENQLLSDLALLLQMISEWRQHFQSLSFRTMFLEDEHNTRPLTVALVRSAVGRPRLDISENILQALHVGAGFSWAHIARNLGISERTLMRRRREYGIGNNGSSNFSDMQIDQQVRGILQVTPGIGYRLIEGALRQRGFRVKRRRVLELMQRVDPVTSTLCASSTIIRPRYSVPCPNSLWQDIFNAVQFCITCSKSGPVIFIIFLISHLKFFNKLTKNIIFNYYSIKIKENDKLANNSN